MSSDVVDLRDFYRTGLGQVARRMIRSAIRRVWPDLRGMRLLGIGYPTPFLPAISAETERTVAVMPASLGVLGWSPEGRNLVTLADEGELPFADYSIDRVLLVHALETTEQVGPMLKEIWRVLAGGGRLLIVAPNRRGIWARLDRTPFGSGRPYTMSQLSQLLRDEQFTPVGSDTALFIPPARKRMILRSARPGSGSASAGFRPSPGSCWSRRQSRSMPSRRSLARRAAASSMRRRRTGCSSAPISSVAGLLRVEIGAGPVSDRCRVGDETDALAPVVELVAGRLEREAEPRLGAEIENDLMRRARRRPGNRAGKAAFDRRDGDDRREFARPGGGGG